MVVAALVLAAAATALAESHDQLVAEANATKATFVRTDPGLATFFAHAPGYVVFPGIGKGAVGVGGAHGNGVVYARQQPVGKASLSQISIGAQLGGQEYAEVIFFETQEALAHFMAGNFTFSGQVSAVALKSGASADAKYRDGVAVFTATKGGLMFDASVGGQKFKYEPFVTRK
jgi:lipid-binding SYLF domain-containing protein